MNIFNNITFKELENELNYVESDRLILFTSQTLESNAEQNELEQIYRDLQIKLAERLKKLNLIQTSLKEIEKSLFEMRKWIFDNDTETEMVI